MRNDENALKCSAC